MEITKLIDIYADWCAPCRLMAPVLEKLEREHHIPVEKVDADKQTDFLSKYQIQGIPTLLVMSGDDVVAKIVGYRPYPRLVAELGLG